MSTHQQGHLFDLPPTPASEHEGVKLSAGQRLTVRNRTQLAAGIHPATGLPVDETHRCGDCAHLRYSGWSSRHHPKCTEHRLGLSHSAASDVRVSWLACTKFEART